MNRKEIAIVMALVGMFVLWPTLHRTLFGGAPPPPKVGKGTTATGANTPGVVFNPTNSAPQVVGTGPTQPGIQNPVGNPQVNPVGPAVTSGQPTIGAVPPAQPQAAALLPADALNPANRVTLKNDLLEVDFTKYGACVIEARMPKYRQFDTETSDEYKLDFSDRPLMAFTGEGIGGMHVSAPFQVTRSSDAEAVFTSAVGGGVLLERRFELGDGYDIKFTDSFVNTSTNRVTPKGYSLTMGWVPASPTFYKYTSNAAVDAYLTSSTSLEYYNSSLFGGTGKMSKWVKKAEGPIDEVIVGARTQWIAVKNKFFATILSIEKSDLPQKDIRLLAEPIAGETEVARVAAALSYDNDSRIDSENELTFHPNTTQTQSGSIYIGPKKYDELEKLSMNQSRILEFRKLNFLCVPMLKILNFFHGIFGNYGIAIILLTAGIRLLFWPLTRLTAHNGKKMAQLSPLMKQINEKHKEDPRKKQEAMMGLYKKYKVNPLKGCFPMLVQIPVFFALYFVIRSVIELRFQDFLWIKDLSEAERLFVDTVGFPVNILPFLMAGSTIIMQKMTPNSLDPMQQKIMMFMPLLFLFILYAFPSGLLLYWTTSNALMALQTYFNMKSVPDLGIKLPAKA